MTLKISAKGEITVVTPRFVPKWSVDLFVRSHHDWITKQLAKLPVRKAADAVPETLQLFGKEYFFKIHYSSKQKTGIHISGDAAWINPINPDHTLWNKNLETQLNRFLKNTAITYISTRTDQLGKKMDITYNMVRYKQQVSRWGSCSSDGNLNFNWRLVHAPPAVIDYVIVHELAHRVHMNHSARFWALVSEFDPEYKQHRGWLKREGNKFFT